MIKSLSGSSDNKVCLKQNCLTIQCQPRQIDLGLELDSLSVWAPYALEDTAIHQMKVECL